MNKKFYPIGVISIIKSPELASIKWSKKESITGDVSGLNN
jgi:hypothetical protein